MPACSKNIQCLATAHKYGCLAFTNDYLRPHPKVTAALLRFTPCEFLSPNVSMVYNINQARHPISPCSISKFRSECEASLIPTSINSSAHRHAVSTHQSLRLLKHSKQ